MSRSFQVPYRVGGQNGVNWDVLERYLHGIDTGTNSFLAGTDNTSSSNIYNTTYFPTWTQTGGNGVDIEFDPAYPTAFIKILTTGIYSINFAAQVLLNANGSVNFYGTNLIQLRRAVAVQPGSDLTYFAPPNAQSFYVPNTFQTPVALMFNAVIRLAVNDSISMEFENLSLSLGTVQMANGGNTNFLIRLIEAN